MYKSKTETGVVPVRLFRVFTFEQIVLNPVTVAKHLIVLTVLDYSCVVSFANKTSCSSQPTTTAGAILIY